MDRSDFRRLLLNEWKPDIISEAFAEAAAEYTRQTEAYDQQVCTGRRGTIAIPATTDEYCLSGRHARKLRGEILSRLCQAHELTLVEANRRWRLAQNDWVGHRDP